MLSRIVRTLNLQAPHDVRPQPVRPPMLEALEDRRLLSAAVANLHSTSPKVATGIHARVAPSFNLTGTFTGVSKLKVGKQASRVSLALSLKDSGDVISGAVTMNGNTVGAVNGTISGNAYTLVISNGLTGLVSGTVSKTGKVLKGTLSLGGSNGTAKFQLKLNGAAPAVASPAGSSLRASSLVQSQAGILAAAGITISGPAQDLTPPIAPDNIAGTARSPVNNVYNIIGHYSGTFTGNVSLDAADNSQDQVIDANTTRTLDINITGQNSDGALEGVMSVQGVDIGDFDFVGYIEDQRVVLVFTTTAANPLEGGGAIEGLLTNTGINFGGNAGGINNASGFTAEFGSGGTQRIEVRGNFATTYAGDATGTPGGVASLDTFDPPTGPGPEKYLDTWNVIGTYQGKFTGSLTRNNPGSADTLLSSNEVRHLTLDITAEDENGTVEGTLDVEGLGIYDVVGLVNNNRLVLQFVEDTADGAGAMEGLISDDGSGYNGVYNGENDASGFSLQTDSLTNLRGAFSFVLGPGVTPTTNDLIQNGSFETPDAINDDYPPSSNGPWIYQGTAGVSQADNSSLGGPDTAPDGEQYAFIKNDTLDPFTNPAGQQISQDVGLTTGFTYTLTFQNAGNSSYSIILDPGTASAQVITLGNTPNGNNSFNNETFAFDFTGTTGTHTLQIRSTGADGTVSFFDDVHLIGVATPPDSGGGTGGVGSNLANDGGFETPDITGDADGTAINAAGGSPWNFGGSSGISDAPSTNLTGPRTAPEGNQYAFLQDVPTGGAGTVGNITQDVAGFLSTNTYRITLRDAGLGSYEVVLDPGTINAKVIRSQITPTSGTAFGGESFGFTTSSGTHTIGIRAVGDDSNFIYIDDVQVIVTGIQLASPGPLNALPGSLIHTADGIDLPGGYTLPGGPIA